MPDRIEFVDLGAIHRELGDAIDAAISDVCSTSAFVGGPHVERFEANFAAFTGAGEAIGVANGTDSLQLLLIAAGLPAGSRVIVPANTFIATAEGVVSAGLEPRFVDVDPESGLIDLDRLAEALDDTVSAIIPVHLYGRIADMEAVMAIAAERDLFVIEDAAQAHAARRGGRHAGTFGHAGSFSFYPGKNLGAYGDAGAIVTDDRKLAGRVRMLANHGRAGDEHPVIGINSRLDGIQAAILDVKLAELERWTEARRAVAETYREELDPAVLDWPGADEPAAESHHLFPILVDGRDELAAHLREHGIPSGVHYRQSVPSTGAFGEVTGEFPVAERRAARQLSLPIHPHLDLEDVARVAELVNAFVGARAGSTTGR